MSKVFTVWRGKDYLGMALKQGGAAQLIGHYLGVPAPETGVCRVLNGEHDTVHGCVVIAHHHNDSLPFTAKEIERVEAEGYNFIQKEINGK